MRSLSTVALAALLVSTTHFTLARNKLTSAAGTAVATISLIDQGGKWTSLDQFRGRLVLLNFVYTGCGLICPVQTEQLARVQRALPGSLQEHVQFLSISLDPANDNPATLKRFALLHGAELANWSFVTGETEALARLAISFAARSRDTSEEDHSADIRLLDPAGTVVQRYSGAPVVVGRIVDDVQELALSKIAFR